MEKMPAPLSVQKALRVLGYNIRTARKKRRMSTADFAARLQVGTQTLARLERGDGSVSARTLATALLALGELGQLEALLDPATDHAGLLMSEHELPQRIRRARKSVRATTGAEPVDLSGASF